VNGKKGIYFLLLIFYFCLALFAACGKKGDPRAPELVVPEPIKDLRVAPDTGGVALTWSRPARSIDGKELRDLAAFVVFRKDLPTGCPECPAPYRERATLDVEDQQKFMKTKRFRFVDQDLAPKMVYRYRVFSKLKDGSLSDPSNEAEISWRPQ
jgi:hypothetical protein